VTGSDPTGLTPSPLTATGILLLGGASSRFGSPKALARFRGETLAERAHRLLGEVCAEVIAVGKEADGLELPFAVLDDGVEERAAAYGVVAGLRAAAHDTCVVLPVDCPLVTAELLRRLVEAEAVPQTGPLPGVYTKAMLPELEERIAYGELSLRGVNERVLELDERLLANANTPVELYAAAVAEWAIERDDVRAILVIGSQARDEVPADRLSDLDLVLFVDDPPSLAADPSWAVSFGTPVLSFVEPAAVGAVLERRVLYEDGQDVDFALFPAATWREITRSPEAVSVVSRGFRLLYDELGLAEELGKLPARAREEPPDAKTFHELAADFWYHALWTARKLRRGEVFVALECLDAYMKARLVTLMGWHARALEPSVDTWHGGRFLERWGDPGALVALEFAYARYSVRDVARALWATIDLFQGLEEETARRLGFELELDHADLRRRIGEVVPDPRRASTLSP
jgi:molybdopterin-guanine dinucleotide biosynthesis protein A